MQKVLITGGSGLIGRKLTEVLSNAGYEVAWLSRNSNKKGTGKIFIWNIQKQYIEPQAITWPDVIIHLAGEGIADKRWTHKRKLEIIESRVNSTALLKKYIDIVPNKITSIICASAIGYYGDRNNEVLTEDSNAGQGFLSDTCIEWENAAAHLQSQEIRLAIVRTGIVLSAKGGALKEFMKSMRFGVAPLAGNGRQIYSWIHIDDLCGIYKYALENKNINGIYNAVAPFPVEQKQFIQCIRTVRKSFALLMPVPAAALRVLLGEMADVILISQNVSPRKIINEGYVFKYKYLEEGLKNIFA